MRACVLACLRACPPACLPACVPRGCHPGVWRPPLAGYPLPPSRAARPSAVPPPPLVPLLSGA
eukprot:3816536-Alexandrium_andersonii.AAC.1